VQHEHLSGRRSSDGRAVLDVFQCYLMSRNGTRGGPDPPVVILIRKKAAAADPFIGIARRCDADGYTVLEYSAGAASRLRFSAEAVRGRLCWVTLTAASF